MTDALRPHLAIDNTETFTSFVRRLAHFHTGQGPDRLLKDYGIDPREINRGSLAGIDAVSRLSGVDVPALEAGTIGRIDRCRIFRGDRWSREFVTPEGARFCPECLAEDIGESGIFHQKTRIAWRLRPVFTCPVHLRQLTQVNDMDGRSDLDAPMYSQHALMTLAKLPVDQHSTLVECWIADKLSNSANGGGAWLDSQTIEQGVRVCEMLGSVLEQGIHVNLRDMPDAALRQYADVGFEVARQGEENVVAALDRIRASSTSTAGQGGPKAKYGRLYEWLAYTTPVVEHGSIRNLVREHILNHTAIEPGEFLLGEEVMERRCHSVYSLSVALKLHPKRLRKVLENKGSIPPDCSDVALNLLVFPADATEAFCRDFLNSVSLAELPLMIGGSRTQVTSLYRVGLLQAVIDRNIDDGIGRIDFSQRAVSGFLAKIEALEFLDDETKAVDLTLASKKSGFSTGQIMSHVFAGEMNAYRMPGKVGLSAIRVSESCLQQIKTRRTPFS